MPVLCGDSVAPGGSGTTLDLCGSSVVPLGRETAAAPPAAADLAGLVLDGVDESVRLGQTDIAAQLFQGRVTDNVADPFSWGISVKFSSVANAQILFGAHTPGVSFGSVGYMQTAGTDGDIEMGIQTGAGLLGWRRIPSVYRANDVLQVSGAWDGASNIRFRTNGTVSDGPLTIAASGGSQRSPHPAAVMEIGRRTGLFTQLVVRHAWYSPTRLTDLQDAELAALIALDDVDGVTAYLTDIDPEARYWPFLTSDNATSGGSLVERVHGGDAAATPTNTEASDLFAAAPNTALALRFGAGAKVLVPQLSPAIVDGIPEAFTLGGELIRWHTGGLLLVAGDAAPGLLRVEVLEDGSGVAAMAAVDGARNVNGSSRYLRRTMDDPRLVRGFVERWLAASEGATDARWLTQAVSSLGTFGTSPFFNPNADEPVAIAGDGAGDRDVTLTVLWGVGGRISGTTERNTIEQLVETRDFIGPASGLATYLASLHAFWWVAYPAADDDLTVGMTCHGAFGSLQLVGMTAANRTPAPVTF